MHIVISGSSGFIGSELVRHLLANGHRVTRLVRRRGRPGEPVAVWDPEQGMIDTALLGDADALVHLAGESIVGRWTAAKKRRILHSRMEGTRLIAQTLARLAQDAGGGQARLPKPPRAWFCASAIGYYGHRGDEWLHEESGSGAGFLAEVCRMWEAETEPAARAGVRVIRGRIGMVLGPTGGALAKMLPPFRLGLGGPIGNGRQYWSWISVADLVGAIQHLLVTNDLQGPVNLVSPAPVTNAQFTAVLGDALRRPAVLPMPAFAARLVFGHMADELLLASQRVKPTRLMAGGYRFRHPDLGLALRDALTPTHST